MYGAFAYATVEYAGSQFETAVTPTVPKNPYCKSPLPYTKRLPNVYTKRNTPYTKYENRC